MDYTNYTASDFICDDSFLRFFLREDDHDVVFWKQWIVNHPEKSIEIEEAIQTLEVLTLNLPKVEFEQELAKMKDHVYGASVEEPTHLRLMVNSEPEPKKPWIQFLLGIASVIVLAVAITAVVLLSRNEDQMVPKQTVSNQLITKRNSNGQKSDLHLPDGSRVFLNSGSSIEFLENFTKNSREVRLEGEAFFDVAHNPKKPFIVNTGRLSVRALGTSFNVKAFDETSAVAVSLVEGKVEVSVPENEGDEKSVLTPGEGVIFDSKSLRVTKQKFDPTMTLAWKNGILNFKNASWDEIINTLTRWYDVEFNIRNAPRKGNAFTGEFDNQSLELVLESLSFTKSFDYKIDGKNVEIEFINQLDN